MTYFLYGLFFLSCIVLIVTVLLQPGKTDAGALFTSSTSSNAYGARGTATVLSKTTIITATIFMLSALMLSMPALNGGVSVLSSNPETTETAPATSTNANVDANAPSNMSPNTNSPVTQPPITDLNLTNPANANTATNTTVNTANKAANTAATTNKAATTANTAKKETNTKK